MTVFLLTFDDVSHFILTNQTSLSMGIEFRNLSQDFFSKLSCFFFRHEKIEKMKHIFGHVSGSRSSSVHLAGG